MFRASKRLFQVIGGAGPIEAYPTFWRNPWRYMKWASREKPTFFWSTVIGMSGPLLMIFGTPIRRKYWYEDRPGFPQTYPIPAGARKIPEGYDDPE